MRRIQTRTQETAARIIRKGKKKIRSPRDEESNAAEPNGKLCALYRRSIAFVRAINAGKKRELMMYTKNKGR